VRKVLTKTDGAAGLAKSGSPAGQSRRPHQG
jgi:hypothetical protein